MAYDLKYGTMLAVETDDHRIGPQARRFNKKEQPVFTLLAQDKLALETLAFYEKRCKEEKVAPYVIRGVGNVIETFHDWEKDNPEKIKLPD